MSSLSSSSSYDKTDKRELIRVDDESIETRRSAKLTRLIFLGLNVKSSSASSENSSPSPSCSLSLFERRSLPAVLKATVLDVSLQFTASTKLNIFFEKVSKEVFFYLCWLSRFSKLNSICDEVDPSALDGLSIFCSSSDYRDTKTKVFDQDGQISGFVEENLSFSRKNGVKSELFATSTSTL